MYEPTPYLKDLVVVIASLTVLTIVSYFYLKLIPIVVVRPGYDGGADRGFRPKCPDRWIENDGVCTPGYKTKCQPFKPELYKGKECEIARECGTTWKGLCN
jgi:hypothetical protein